MGNTVVNRVALSQNGYGEREEREKERERERERVRERGRERDCQQDGHALIQEILSKNGAHRVTSSAGMPPPASAVTGMASLADLPRADDQH
eukprot:4424453-Heterocapsa_arctica.AAC.1